MGRSVFGVCEEMEILKVLGWKDEVCASKVE